MFHRTLFLLLLLSLSVAGADRTPQEPGRSGRSVLAAKNGIVATSHPLAAQVGLDILQSGGNAVDAAIATSAAMGLMEPMSCGIGGDLFAIVWDAKSKKLYGLNASGRAPFRANRAHFAERGLDQIPSTGPLSWSVPGCVDGWAELRNRFGTKPFTDLLEPSIRYAEDGVPVPEVIAGYWAAGAARIARDPGMAETFLVPDGNGGRRPPRFGEVFKNPFLAHTYRLIAKHGRDGFYQGENAEKLVALSDKLGGFFSTRDFAEHTSTWVAPVSTNYRGYDVWEIPPPGQGIAVLQILNLLEPHNLQSKGPMSVDYWHRFIEAKKLAYADRARFYADPTFAKVPIGELISKEYAMTRGKLIDPAKAAIDVPHGDPKLGKADTIYLCVVDQDRNCVSLIQSNYSGFGSAVAAPGTGYAIQNRGCLFALDEKHLNRLEPGKRPFHTIIPAMVTQNNEPRFVLGVMGGDMQPQGQVQVLVNLIDFGMDVQAAGEAPRMEHIGSATPTGESADGGGTLLVEDGINDALVGALREKGHEIRRVRRNGGGYQGIWIDPKTGVLFGATEARKDGAAVGY